jgi:hypothetical protein
MSTIFTPVVDADAVYGEGDWRPLLGDDPRKDAWKVYMIGKQSVEHKLRGVILPSYDYTMSIVDQAFKSSVGACWTNQPQKGLERHFSPNAFAIPLLMYPFLGPQKEHWLSPANRRNMIGNDALDPDDAADAFDDLNKWVRRNKSFSQARKDFFLKADKMTDDPPIPGRTVRYVALNECRDRETDWHLAVTVFTASAHSYLIEQMRWRHQDATPPRDSKWPQYMLGDPTDPAAALEWNVNKVQLDPKDPQETNVLCFTDRREFLDPDQKVRKISDAVLAKRFVMSDPDNWNLPTYEDQVEFMMANFDAAVTADMIRAACSYRCRFEIPNQRPESVRLQAEVASSEESRQEGRSRATSRQSEDEPVTNPMDAVTGGGFAPKSTPPMPQGDVAPASAPAPSPTLYWAGPGGSTPTQMTVAALQAVADSGNFTGFKVNMDGKADWRNLADCGLVRLPAPPQASVPPQVPGDVPASVPADVPASVPTETASPRPATTPDSGITLEAMGAKLFPDAAVLASFSPEQREKADALIRRAWEATERGTKRDFPPDVVEELMQLIG